MEARLKPTLPRAALLSRAATLLVAVIAVAVLVVALPFRAAESEDGASATADLEVGIAGIRSDAGTIMIGLYDSVGGFTAAIEHCTEGGLLNDKGRLVGMALRAASGTRRVVFTQLPPGRYAVIVFHDENDNGRLDENAWACRPKGMRSATMPKACSGLHPSMRPGSHSTDRGGASPYCSFIRSHRRC